MKQTTQMIDDPSLNKGEEDDHNQRENYWCILPSHRITSTANAVKYWTSVLTIRSKQMIRINFSLTFI